jgi:hypothetical protein
LKVAVQGPDYYDPTLIHSFFHSFIYPKEELQEEEEENVEVEEEEGEALDDRRKDGSLIWRTGK